MCVNRPPVWVLCPNYEVVLFQPCTLTAKYLGPITIFSTFIIAPTAPPFSTVSGYL